MIELCIGPMFAQKTTWLLRHMKKYKRTSSPMLIIKYVADTRSKDLIKSHDGEVFKAIEVKRLADYRDTAAEVIIIDEGQFFDDLAEICNYWAGKGKKVYIAALSTDINNNVWPNVSKIIPYVDKIKKLTAICELCDRDAIFTKRRKIKDDLIAIGGSDLYYSVCRKCEI